VKGKGEVLCIFTRLSNTEVFERCNLITVNNSDKCWVDNHRPLFLWSNTAEFKGASLRRTGSTSIIEYMLKARVEGARLRTEGDNAVGAKDTEGGMSFGWQWPAGFSSGG
jgi:hypothetical protein